MATTKKIVRRSSFPIHQITRLSESKPRYSDPSPKFCFGDLFPHLYDEPTSPKTEASEPISPKTEASETSSGSIAVDQRSNDQTHSPNTASMETRLQLLAHQESSKPIYKIDVDQRLNGETDAPNTVSLETHLQLLGDEESSPATVSTSLVDFMEFVGDEHYVEAHYWGNTESQTLLSPPQVISPLNYHDSPHPETLNSQNSPNPNTLTLNDSIVQVMKGMDDSIVQVMKGMENLKKAVERMGPNPAHQEESDLEMGIEKKCLKLKSVGTMCWVQIRNAVVDFACKTFWMWIVFLIFGSWALSALKKFFRED